MGGFGSLLSDGRAGSQRVCLSVCHPSTLATTLTASAQPAITASTKKTDVCTVSWATTYESLASAHSSIPFSGPSAFCSS